MERGRGLVIQAPLPVFSSLALFSSWHLVHSACVFRAPFFMVIVLATCATFFPKLFHFRNDFIIFDVCGMFMELIRYDCTVFLVTPRKQLWEREMARDEKRRIGNATRNEKRVSSNWVKKTSLEGKKASQ